MSIYSSSIAAMALIEEIFEDIQVMEDQIDTVKQSQTVQNITWVLCVSIFFIFMCIVQRATAWANDIVDEDGSNDYDDLKVVVVDWKWSHWISSHDDEEWHVDSDYNDCCETDEEVPNTEDVSNEPAKKNEKVDQ